MAKTVTFEGSYTAKTKASAQALWALWTDVNHWHEWDNGIARAEIKDEFRAGKSFSLKPQGGDDTFQVQLKTVTPGKEFSDETVLPFGVLRGTHKIETDGKQNKVTVGLRAEVSEEASEFFSKEIWPHMDGGLSEAVDNLISLAEARAKG
jgi:hypothetical protein